MSRYEMVPQPVDAMQFDGTRAGVEELVAWAKVVAPFLPFGPGPSTEGGTT